MSWWMWAAAAAGLEMYLLFLSKITIHTYYSRSREDDRFFLGLRVVYGLFRYRYEIPVMDLKSLLDGIQIKTETVNEKQSDLKEKSGQNLTLKKITEYFRQTMEILHVTPNLKDWIRKSLSRLHCTDLKWGTRIGLGGAAETAVAAGIVWSLKSSLLGLAFQFVHLDTKPEINVTPQYNQTFFSTEFSCITKIRLGHVLWAALVLLFRILKVKGGIKTWQNVLSRS